MNESPIARHDFGGLVANAFRLYFQHARSLIAICLIVLLPAFLGLDALRHFFPENNTLRIFDIVLRVILQLTAETFLVGALYRQAGDTATASVLNTKASEIAPA